jgi:bifunctional UDP-N-acetylglucosamine pyrophosphorylase/glucosamine-1-phosphate N-acetyltransferase
MKQNTAAVILAAGKGTRMKSAMPKVMHKIAGWPMIKHVVTTCENADVGQIITVIADGMDDVAQAVSPHQTVIQTSQKGTGDAAKSAKSVLQNHDGYVFILNGDGPFIQKETLGDLLQAAEKTGLSVLGCDWENPHGYGRFIIKNGFVTEIVEEKDCDDDQRRIKIANAGAYCVRGDKLFGWLDQLSDDNAQGEYYLTDLIAIAAQDNVQCAYSLCDEAEAMGINSRAQLAEAEAIMQAQLRGNAMANGATMIDPASVTLSIDSRFGQDVVIEPNVFFGLDVRVGDNTHIRAFSHIEGTDIGENSEIGPFARIRPKSKIGNNVFVGNFIEVNRSEFKDGAKSKHVSYIGDAVIGEKSNIGAGTVIANYDGFNKHQTIIGKNVFVGSNSTLVAPMSVGDDAIIGAGSTITKNIQSSDMAIARTRQIILEGHATKYRKGKSK